jgi:rhamnogalacturonan endolyase
LKVRVNGGGGADGSRVFTWPELLGDNNAIACDGTRGGMWSMDMAIRGGLLEEGDDTVYITLNVFVGVMYDYIRLEGPPSL